MNIKELVGKHGVKIVASACGLSTVALAMYGSSLVSTQTAFDAPDQVVTKFVNAVCDNRINDALTLVHPVSELGSDITRDIVLKKSKECGMINNIYGGAMQKGAVVEHQEKGDLARVLWKPAFSKIDDPEFQRDRWYAVLKGDHGWQIELNQSRDLDATTRDMIRYIKNRDRLEQLIGKGKARH